MPDAVARASGATAVLDGARVVATLAEAIAGCALAIGLSARPRESPGVCCRSARQRQRRSRTRPAATVALVFGTEMSGLSNDELARCGVVATIPANPAYGSLNLAAAVQVACYELRVARTAGASGARRVSRPRPPTRSPRSTPTPSARWSAMRFLNPRLPRRLMPRLRRLFARAGLEKEEVNILRGILARIDDVMRR